MSIDFNAFQSAAYIYDAGCNAACNGSARAGKTALQVAKPQKHSLEIALRVAGFIELSHKTTDQSEHSCMQVALEVGLAPSLATKWQSLVQQAGLWSLPSLAETEEICGSVY